METDKIEKSNRNQIIEQLRAIVEPWVSDNDLIDHIKEETNLIADLGMDSIGVLQLILGIEREFGISIKNHELDSRLLSMLGNLVNMIQSKLNEDN